MDRHETLARKLGQAPHLSPLRRKAKQLGLLDPDDWIALAVARGCKHYDNQRRIRVVTQSLLSNEELSALCLSSANPYYPPLIRVAAQLLSDPNTDIPKLVHLCAQEHALLALKWITIAGKDTEPGNVFWEKLQHEIQPLLKNQPFPTAVFPHPSRFRVESGFQRHAKIKVIDRKWLRPTH